MSNTERKVNILECTLRDGSYAVDFKFTEADTKLLTGLLSQLGFQWIEVGHGFGLGASEAGKGKMPSSDNALIRVAKSMVGDGLIGMFCIPGIATLDILTLAKSAGLDFVRIGQNATNAETALPFLEKARELGLIPMMNFMKSYAIKPEELGKKARVAHEAGAEVIYLVDSVGGMFPEDVARYCDAIRAHCNCKLGFHSHNNLQLAIANSIQAYRSGATFIDTTLYGLGRSAGNAQTEVMVAVFEKMGVATGIDLFKLLDLAEAYMWPMMEQIHMHDMMAVAMGYGQFHSSNLPKVLAAAREYKVDLKRLVVAMGQLDPVDINDRALAETAASLANSESKRESPALLSFQVPELGQHRVTTSLNAVRSLLEGMAVTSAKRGSTQTVLELVPTDIPNEDIVLPDFIMADREVVMGRVTYGSYEILKHVLDLAKSQIFMFLIDQRQSGWAKESVHFISEHVGKERCIPIRGDELRSTFIADTLELAGQRFGRQALMVYGVDAKLIDTLIKNTSFEQIFVYGIAPPSPEQGGRLVILRNKDDWLALNLRFDLILCISTPSEPDSKALMRCLSLTGKILFDMPFPGLALKENAKEKLIHIDLRRAYSGLLTRLLASISLLAGDKSYED
jgi:4-hydroxy-2-oxovalerate aldolase